MSIIREQQSQLLLLNYLRFLYQLHLKLFRRETCLFKYTTASHNY